MLPYSTAEQKYCTNDPDSIYGATEGRLQLIRVASFLVLASYFSHQRFWLLSTILHTWPMQLLQFRIWAHRDCPKINFCWLFPLAFYESIFLHSGHRAGCIFFFSLIRCSPCKDESYFTLFARYSHVLRWPRDPTYWQTLGIPFAMKPLDHLTSPSPFQGT